MSCCPEGSWPQLNVDYQPKGTKFNLPNGSEVYHNGTGKRVLILVSDIFGASSGRHQGIADSYAQFGYNVYVPEILPEVYSGPLDFAVIVPYIKNLNRDKMTQTFDQLLAVIEKQGYKQYFMAGFCWGVWKVCDISTQGYQGLVAFAGFHPSITAENLYGGNDVELSKKVKHPGFLYPAVNDQANIKQGGEIIKIWQQTFGVDKTGTLQFPDMVHGWMTRSDYSAQNVQRDIEKALQHSHEYFSKFQI